MSGFILLVRHAAAVDGYILRTPMSALPAATFFLFLEASVGGVIAVFLVHLRGQVSRGFTLFTGWTLWVCGGLAVWLRSAFPPLVLPELEPLSPLWFGAERALTIAFLALLAFYLVALQSGRRGAAALLAPIVPLVGLGGLWSAALVEPSGQIAGLGAPLAVLAGGLALGAAVAGLSLGHWYLVAPDLSVQPLITLTFLCLGAIGAQAILLPLLLLFAGPAAERIPLLFGEQAIFFAVRILFGLLLPAGAAVLVWRTARIRSLDSATGILYVLATLVLAGEIAARSLFFLTGVAT